MTGVEGNMNYDMVESVKPVRAKEAEGQFLKLKGGEIDETDEEEEIHLNSASSESVVHIKSDVSLSDGNKDVQEHKKGILKHERTYSNKHVDFNLDVEFVPFDESKDYTIEIQIVEQMPKKIISYAALFAQQALEEQLRQQKGQLKSNSKSDKNCVKNKKEKKHEQDSGSFTAIAKNLKCQNVYEVKGDPTIKKSEECLAGEHVIQETLDNSQKECQPLGEEVVVLSKTEQINEEVVAAGEICQDEKGDFNVPVSRECQDSKMEEYNIDNESKNKESSEEQEKGQEPQDTEMCGVLGEYRKQDNDAFNRKENEEQGHFEDNIQTNDQGKNINDELIESSNIEKEQYICLEVCNEKLKHSEENSIEEDNIRSQEETVTIDETINLKTEESIIERVEGAQENKCVINEQNEKDDETSDDYYDTEENINTESHSLQNENEENIFSDSNEIQSDGSICEDCKESHETPIRPDELQDVLVPSNVEETCIRPESKLDQQCCLLNERISENVNENSALNKDIEINNNKPMESQMALGISIDNPNEQEETNIIKLDETIDSDVIEKLNNIRSHSCPVNGVISNVPLDLGELAADGEINELEVQALSNESESEVGKGDYIGQNNSNFAGSNNQLESLDQQQECQNLLESLPESLAGDEKIPIKLDENDVPNQTTFCKMEAVGTSNSEINNSR